MVLFIFSIKYFTRRWLFFTFFFIEAFQCYKLQAQFITQPFRVGRSQLAAMQNGNRSSVPKGFVVWTQHPKEVQQCKQAQIWPFLPAQGTLPALLPVQYWNEDYGRIDVALKPWIPFLLINYFVESTILWSCYFFLSVFLYSSNTNCYSTAAEWWCLPTIFARFYVAICKHLSESGYS